MFQGSLFITNLFVQPSECVGNQRRRAPALVRQIAGGCGGTRQYINSVFKKPGPGEVVSEIQSRLQIAASSSQGADWDGERLLLLSYKDAPRGQLLGIGQDGLGKGSFIDLKRVKK